MGTCEKNRENAGNDYYRPLVGFKSEKQTGDLGQVPTLFRGPQSVGCVSGPGPHFVGCTHTHTHTHTHTCFNPQLRYPGEIPPTEVLHKNTYFHTVLKQKWPTIIFPEFFLLFIILNHILVSRVISSELRYFVYSYTSDPFKWTEVPRIYPTNRGTYTPQSLSYQLRYFNKSVVYL